MLWGLLVLHDVHVVVTGLIPLDAIHLWMKKSHVCVLESVIQCLAMLVFHMLTSPSLLSLRAVRVPFQQMLPEGKIIIAPDGYGRRCGALWRLGVLGEMMMESMRELSPSGDVFVKVSWSRLCCWAGLSMKSRREGCRSLDEQDL